jgi:ATP-dependent DNA helicase RecQ
LSDLLDTLALALAREDSGILRNIPRPTSPIGPAYPVWRLGQAWTETFGPDEALLVRQAIRSIGNHLFCPDISADVQARLVAAGVQLDAASRLTADAFRPEWLNLRTGDNDVDAAVTQRVSNEQVVGEAYLEESFGYSHWKSQALKEACWTVHVAAPGSTVLVALPTGSGKSLCFHFLARFSSGLNLVIVPTVALAIDQYRSAKTLDGLNGLEPRYFAADDPEFSPQQVAAEVRGGSSRLVFCSPESCVSGRLRPVLDQLVDEGRLENVVIDEAHMVGTWGMYFRVDFQLFSALWKQWRTRSRNTLKTILLSATFTEECRKGLATLFPSDTWTEYISQRLRSELTYYSARFSSEQNRSSAVLESIWRLPRPGILYTTRVEDAIAWKETLTAQGFRRVECFTGETSSRQRRGLLTMWREDKLDLMVATSAFGLGVDKSDVRTVVHACLPEDLDRFYQEVGRAGRDGCSAISVLATTPKDDILADGMGPTLLLPRTIQQRWESLWRTRQQIDARSHVYRINLRTKKDLLVGTRTYEENVRWNKRLLLQLYRAGQIDLRNLQSDNVEGDKVEWATIELRFPPESPDIVSLIGEIRDAELRVLESGLTRMRFCVSSRARICVILAKMYGRGTLRVCGGCEGCRDEDRPIDQCPPLPIPNSPASAPLKEAVAGFPRLTVAGTGPHPLARWVRRTAHAKGVRRFACAGEDVNTLTIICKEAFGGDPAPYRVDGLGEDKRNWECPFRLELNERLVIIHGRSVHRGAWNLKTGHAISHWLCDGCDPVDDRGRHWLDYPGIRPHREAEAWIATGEINVYR